jgi:hypothetical protein
MKDTVTILLELPGHATPLYPITHRIVAEVDRVITDRITTWRMFSAKWSLHTEDFYGKPIHYEGVRYEGAPRLVFLGRFIEPFLENGIVQTIEKVHREANQRGLDPRPHVSEAISLLHLLIRKTYTNMAHTDRVLRGNGFPNSVEALDVTDKTAHMDAYLKEYSAAFLTQGPKQQTSGRDDIVEFKPNFYGIGINFNAIWRRIRRYFEKRV